MCSPVLSDICRGCGSPIVRSAISLKVLPLVLVEPAEDSSMSELIEKISSVKIANSNGQIIKVNQEDESATLLQVLRDNAVIEDGRGVILPRESYDLIGPTRSYIVDDYTTDPVKMKDLAVNNVVKRVFVLVDNTVDV